jgi:hypothetical protein
MILPWVEINLMGHQSFNAIEITSALIGADISNHPQNGFGLADVTSSYADTSFAFISTMFVYWASIVMTVVAVASKSHRSQFALIAGILHFSAGTAWIYSVETVKDHFTETALSMGGIVGEEWKENEDKFIDSIIAMGTAHYIVIGTGISAIFTGIWWKGS